MPLSLLEAMSYGNCCVISDIEECTQVVEDHGVTFSKGDVSALADRLQALCDNERTVGVYKAAAADYITEAYNWADVVKRTLEIYGGLR